MSPLISCEELFDLRCTTPTSVQVIDCSFDLADPSAGRRAFLSEHIAGAAYVHLEDELSAPRSGTNGRHPLAAIENFVGVMRSIGADDDSLVVVYDTVDGRYAARLWWMVRWAGHARVCLLDGGLRAWRSASLPLETGPAAERRPGNFTRRASLERVVTFEDVCANLRTNARIVMDARARDRFRGENETLDPVAGHIPGAMNRPYHDNLMPDGRMRAPAELRAAFDALLAGRSPSDLIHQCGSGVTSCHNRLAMEAAGLQGGAMYVGSWSEWIAHHGAAVETGII